MSTFLVGLVASLALIAATIALLDAVPITTVEATNTAAVHVVGQH